MTTDLKPGTPEYDEAYKKEMERLEAEAGKKPAKAEADKTTSEASDKKDADDGTESADEIKARLEKAESDLKTAQKAIKDTQRWGHKNAEEVKKLKREADDRKHREALAGDPLIVANPGLEETIKRIAQPARANGEDAKAAWLDTVARAIPDIETLLGDQAFHALASAKRSELGNEWDEDPIIAIRELSALRTEHLMQRNVTVAVDAARKDFEAKAKKRIAMDVPGGSGGKDAPQIDDSVERYKTMTKEEFAKERSRVMGY